MAVIKNHHIKKESFILLEKKSYEVHPTETVSPSSVFKRSQWGGQKAMGVRLAPSFRCPHCHFCAAVVKAQSGKNSIDQTPGTVAIFRFHHRVSESPKLLPLASTPSLYCPSTLTDGLRRILRYSLVQTTSFCKKQAMLTRSSSRR